MEKVAYSYVIVYKVLVFDRNTWNHIIVYKFVLG